jgi:chromosome segregation ATPase
MLRDPAGGWVSWEDYARLKAEVERLTSDLQMEKENEDRLVREWQKANNEVYGLQTQVAALIDDQTRLKAEVERLKNAIMDSVEMRQRLREIEEGKQS